MNIRASIGFIKDGLILELGSHSFKKEELANVVCNTVEYYSVIKKELKPLICKNMNGPCRYFVQWNKSERHKCCIISLVWNLKTKTNKIKTSSEIQISDWWLAERKRVAGWVKLVKELNCMVIDGNQTCGSDHFVEYTDVK